MKTLAPLRTERRTKSAFVKEIEKIPFFADYDSMAQKLTLRGAAYFPIDALLPFREVIKVLDASKGTLSSLPDALPKLGLEGLFLSENPFRSMPKVLAKCTELRMVAFKSCRMMNFDEDTLPLGLCWLILTDNEIEKLPKSIGDLVRLRKLGLAGNFLTELPTEMEHLVLLELIRISANRLERYPSKEFFSSLSRLCWYSEGSNPCTKEREVEPAIKEILWSDITLHGLPKESPSSQVYRGKWNDTQVAVKLFKQDRITSDGRPELDRLASLTAGVHPNIVPLLGKLKGHPAKSGLVLKWLPHEKLADVPDPKSVTRDRFHPAPLPVDILLELLRDVTSACLHLSQKGLTQGDLYWHNILVRILAGHGSAHVGDFGATSFISPKENRYSDVRAFGCLIEDALPHITVGTDRNKMAKLRALRQECGNENFSALPSFETICTRLKG